MKISAYIPTNIVLFIFFFVVFEAHAALYRCELENGQLLYQQSPCNVNSSPFILKNRSSGWSPLRDSERALLRQSKPTKKIPAQPDSDAKTKSELKQCWSKRKKLQAVREKLRHGYKLKESAVLHRNRDDHEDYLKQFCSF